jgi:hypothetical protein
MNLNTAVTRRARIQKTSAAVTRFTPKSAKADVIIVRELGAPSL